MWPHLLPLNACRPLVCSSDLRPGTRSTGLQHAPRIFSFERLVEVEHAGELIARVGWLADEQSFVDEVEDNLTDVGGRANTPVFEHETGHHAEVLEGEITTGHGELASRDVPALIEPRLAILERGEHEQVRVLPVARIAGPEAVHDAVLKAQRQSERPFAERAPTCGGRRQRAQGQRYDAVSGITTVRRALRPACTTGSPTSDRGRRGAPRERPRR